MRSRLRRKCASGFTYRRTAISRECRKTGRNMFIAPQATGYNASATGVWLDENQRTWGMIIKRKGFTRFKTSSSPGGG
jgi:hypothetical protein